MTAVMTPLSRNLPYERSVTCDCDRTFHLPLGLLISPESEPAHACVRCGRITCTDVLWTHVHHNTYDAHGRSEYSISDDTRAWLDLWPRVLRGNDFDDYAFLPAAVRCTDVTDFQLHSARVFSASRALARGRRLREAGIPSAPPPACLPDQLKNYRTLWELNQELTPDRDISFLLKNAQPIYRLSSPLALDALLQRSDLPEIFEQAFRTLQNENIETVCALVREKPTALPLALPGLLTWLDQRVRSPGATLYNQRLLSLLDFLAVQKSAAMQIVPALEAIKTGVDLHEYEFLRKLIATIHSLKGEPSVQVSQRPWFFN